jgi:flagellin-like hook-associated protein FlgL
MEDIIDSLQTIRRMVQERNRFLQDVANLVVQAANVGLTTVDSGVLVQLMEQHQTRVNEILNGVNVANT